MPLVLSSEARMVRDTAHDFFRERSPVTALRKLRDSNDPDGFSRPLWREMAELGWTGFLVPEDHGGSDFGVTGLAQVMEAAGRTLAATPLLSTALLGASLLSLAGSEDQKAEYLPALVAGEHLFALALEETSRHAPNRIGTTATADGGSYRLTGRKTFVLDGHVADTLIVTARTGGGRDGQAGITLFLVPADAPGVTRTRTIMVDSRNAAQVTLDNAAGTVLGPVGGGAGILETVLDRARTALAALAALAKAKASDTLYLCGNEGVQMHGGIGMTDEHEIGFFMKRARVAQATFGDSAWCRDRYAGLMGY
jgi:acyl-CoA dehydrogenase